MSPRKTKKVDDAALKASLLAAALSHVALEGFAEKTLALAAKDLGYELATVNRLFPDGAQSFVETFSQSADAEMLRILAAIDLKAMKIRMRISTAVMARIEALRPHKEAARRAAAFLSLPPNALLGAKLLYRTVDAIWRATGDTATDFNFYTKRAILAGVYSSTLVRWFTDTTADEALTTVFLADRIENVMQFERIKAGVKRSLDRLPPLSDVLASLSKRD